MSNTGGSNKNISSGRSDNCNAVARHITARQDKSRISAEATTVLMTSGSDIRTRCVTVIIFWRNLIESHLNSLLVINQQMPKPAMSTPTRLAIIK
jgi:hypothetical protein